MTSATDLKVDVLHSKHLKLADGEKRQPDADAVPQSSDHGVPHHRADVLKKGPGGHEVAAVQDDGREHVEEEDVGAEHSGGLFLHRVHDGTDDEADGNQEAGLRDPDCDFMVDVESCREDDTMHKCTKTNPACCSDPDVPILAKEARSTHNVNSKGTCMRG